MVRVLGVVGVALALWPVAPAKTGRPSTPVGRRRAAGEACALRGSIGLIALLDRRLDRRLPLAGAPRDAP